MGSKTPCLCRVMVGWAFQTCIVGLLRCAHLDVEKQDFNTQDAWVFSETGHVNFEALRLDR